jgi:ABC-type multidrug transport system permease subunit
MFYGSLFWNLTDTEYVERLSLLFFCLLFMVIGHQQAIPLLFEERLLFYRERGANAYGFFPYWVSSWFMQIPLTALNTLIFTAILYHMAGLRSGGYGVFFVCMLFTSFTALFTSHLIAFLCPTAQTAIGFFPVSLLFGLIFSGYVIYFDDLPIYLRAWAPYSSFARWSFQAAVLNEFQNNPDLPQGEAYIEELSFNTYTRGDCIGFMPIYTVIMAVGALAALRLCNFEER